MTDLIKKWTDSDYMPFSSQNTYFGAILKLMFNGGWVRRTDVYLGLFFLIFFI